MSGDDYMPVGSMVFIDDDGPGICLAIGDGEDCAPDEVTDWPAERVTISNRLSLEEAKRFIAQLIEEIEFLEAMSKTFDRTELKALEAEAEEVLGDE